MPRTLPEVAHDLNTLRASDFETGMNGWERLDALCDEIIALNDANAAAPLLFATMERLDGCDVGTPGSLVHTLEQWSGVYERHLAESIKRKPCELSVWMLNRILNARAGDRTTAALLQSVPHHPAASPATKAQAKDFLSYQGLHE